MPTIALEGVGATIAFGTSDFTADLVSLTLPEKTREALETTHLGTEDAKTFKPAVLKNVGTITAVFDHDPDDFGTLIDSPPEQVTITYPVLPGQSVGTKLVFTAFASSEGGEELAVDTLARTNVTLQISGDITVTPAVPAAS